MKNIIVVGAGQLGSRHLQALKKLNQDLNIHVIDPSMAALNIAKERYDSINGLIKGKNIFLNKDYSYLPKHIDLVINATNSDIRFDAIKNLFDIAKIEFLVMEKLLFKSKDEFYQMDEIILKHNTKTWVNCSMRAMPFYAGLKNHLSSRKIRYCVNGGQYGLVTNSIHFIDHIAYLTNCSNFEVITDSLIPEIYQSKRKGFLELNGKLSVKFEDGSVGDFLCSPVSKEPLLVQIFSDDFRCISKESEGKSWISSSSENWIWTEIESPIPFQSEMTTKIAEEILNKGTCPLVDYKESMKIHITLLEALNDFLNKISVEKYNYYQFT